MPRPAPIPLPYSVTGAASPAVLNERHFWLLGALGVVVLGVAVLAHVFQMSRASMRGHDRAGSNTGRTSAVAEWLRRATRWSAAVGTVIPVIVLFGWTIRSVRLVTVFPGLVAMNPMTAVGLLLTSAALWLGADGRDPAELNLDPRNADERNPAAGLEAKGARSTRHAAIAWRVRLLLGMAVFAFGVSKFVALIFHLNLPIDRLLFDGRLGMVPGLPTNRMAPNTALSLALLGAAVAAIDVRTRRRHRPSEALALASGLLALLALVGYLYDATSFYHVATFIPMALHAAITVAVLSLGILFARPADGWMAVLTGDSVGGMTARRLLPAAVLLPVAMGWLRILGIHAGLFDPEFGTSLLVVATVVVFGSMAWSTASLLHRADVRRRQVEVDLRHGEERYRTVVEQAAEGIYMVDADSRCIVEANAALQRLLGYSPGEVRGRPIYDIIVDEPAGVDARMAKVLAANGPLMGERQYRRKDGAVVDVQASASIIRYDGRRMLCTVVHDITEQKRADAERQRAADLLRDNNRLLEDSARSERLALEALRKAHDDLKKAQGQLVQSEKLVGLGQMVAGVAHEINNPLSYVANNVAVLQRDVKALTRVIDLYQPIEAYAAANQPDLLEPLKEFVEQVDLAYTLSNLQDLMARSRDGLKRIQQIVKDLRDFARLDETDVKEVDLNTGIESTLNIIRGRARKKDVALKTELAGLPLVTCAAGKINQVVMNLVANAIDACPGGGEVVVSSRRAGANVLVEVRDNGSGIPPDVRQRIFDPFFTTKPQGEGTGLGLSISYGIIQDHGGTIDVDSTPGAGSTFTVTLPINAIVNVKPRSSPVAAAVSSRPPMSERPTGERP